MSSNRSVTRAGVLPRDPSARRNQLRPGIYLVWTILIGVLSLFDTTTLCVAHAGEIIYTIPITTDSFTGNILSGTITTDGTIGDFVSTNFINWDLTISTSQPNPSVLLNMTPATSFIPFSLLRGVTASSSELVLSQPIQPPFDILHFRELGKGPAQNPYFIEWDTFEGSRIIAGQIGLGPTLMQVATTTPYLIAGVPEPSTFVLEAIGAVAIIAYGWACRRKDRHPQEAGNKADASG